jgi:hypothetical protein
MLPWWLQDVQAVAVVLIALIGAWIAYQQMHIAAVRLRFDLYQKRYAVFEAARRLLAEVKKHPTGLDFDLEAYDLGTADAVFLFLHTDDLSNYLGELREHAINLRDLNKRLFPPMNFGTVAADDEKRLSEERNKELDWFGNQTTELVKQFKPFLRFD